LTDLVADSSATIVTRVCPTGRPLFHTKTNIIDISLNGTAVQSRQFYNQSLYTPQVVVDPALVLNTATVPPGILLEGANSFGFRGRSFSGSGTTIPEYVARFLLDWYRVTYARALIARGGALRLDTSKGTGGMQRIRVRAFSAGDLLLFDITAPESPVFVSLDPAQIVADGGGGFDLRFAHDNGAGVGSYAATREAAIPVAANVTRVRRPTLLAGGVGSRYAVVAHDDFEAGAAALAEYRSTRYPGAAVALLSEVYDVFGNGRIHPDAIKAYSAYAYHRWSTPLEFLCLIGDASEDHRAAGVDADPDLLPSHSLWSVYEGAPEDTDQYFAEVTRNGLGGFDELSDLYVGRFAVNTPDELDWNLQRMRDYESEDLDELWRRKTLLLADDALSGDLGAGVGSGYGWRSNELGFCRASRDYAELLESHPLDTLLPDVFCWGDLSHPCENDCNEAGNLNCEVLYGQDCGIWYDCRIFPYDVDNWRDEFECQRANVKAAVLPLLRSKLDDGVFIWNYEGHANKYFLAHEEVWRDDRNDRHDVDYMANEGRPFIFLGFACHLAEFDREDEAVQGDCLSEKMMNVRQVGLERPAGCIASFASSGYEFLGPNLDLNEFVFRAFFFPDSVQNDSSGSGLPDDGEPDAYVWTLGEATTRARLEFQERYLPGGSDFRAAARRFVLLGDPALSPDFGTPSVEVTVNGVPVEDPSTDFFASPDEYAGDVQVVMTAAEGRGITAMRIVDSQLGEVDPAAYVVTTDQQTSDGVPQIRTLTYDFQFRSGEIYSLSFEAVDGAGHAARFVIRTDTRFEFVDGEAAIYPNPFADRTRLVFRLPSRAHSGTLGVYTIAGRRILERSLGGFAPNEQLEVEWDGRDEGGLPVANGTYFLRLKLAGASGSIEETFPVVRMR
ncbi:hypothetical protein K8I85_02875, partial [bacterium]|nr:hypothetical protein [bacterium]